MLAVVLALAASVGWGTSDFLGGLKSRRLPMLSVLLVSQASALAVLLAFVLGSGATRPGGTPLAYAALAGISETVAIAALYRGLAVGTMSVVAPIAAMAPAVAVIAGLAQGEIPGPVQSAGLVLATLGVVVISVKRGEGSRSTGVVYGLLAALGFGFYFITLDTASEASVPWSLVTARATAVALVAVVVLATRTRAGVPRPDLPSIVLIGLLIVVADAFFAIATTLGLVGVAAVLGSLHTVVTVALAAVVLHERLNRLQQAGIAASIAGVLAIAAG